MANYPTSIFSPRVLVDRVGAVYDALKTKVFYAKDHNDPLAEIVAIETELGTNPKGAYADVKAWLTALSSAVGTIVTTFLGLSDTPSSYAGSGGKVVAVKSDASGLEFISAPGGDPLDAYPVGAVYISVVSTSPATLFGGTWSAFAAGRVLVGIDSGDTDFDTVEETRGAKTHTLTIAELASHSHDTSIYENGTYAWAPARSGFLKNSGAPITDFGTKTAGSGSAHNNIQPSIVVYMWKRTA